MQKTGVDGSSTRKRNKYVPAYYEGGLEFDPMLPCGPNVYLPRKSKPDPWWVMVIEAIFVIGAVLLSLRILSQ